MTELRWLEYEYIEERFENGSQLVSIHKKLQYRIVNDGYEIKIFTDWIDVPTVRDEK